MFETSFFFFPQGTKKDKSGGVKVSRSGGMVKWLIGYFVKYRGFFANCLLPIANSFFKRSSCEVYWGMGIGAGCRGWVMLRGGKGCAPVCNGALALEHRL
jgi:hypothetical protein